jgi:hypothetical protein
VGARRHVTATANGNANSNTNRDAVARGYIVAAIWPEAGAAPDNQGKSLAVMRVERPISKRKKTLTVFGLVD